MQNKRNLIQLCLLWAAMLPAAVQAQFTFTTNNDGSLNLSQYTGSGGVVLIPSATNGLTVTSIGTNAFQNCTSLASVTIPTSVTSIGDGAFQDCTRLTGVTIPNSVTTIGAAAFNDCSLTNVTIPNSVTSIEDEAFYYCTSLTNITIGASVTNIGLWAFADCNLLTGVYFQGNVPSLGYYGAQLFEDDGRATVYYLPGTSGWSSQFGSRPAAMLNPPNPDGSLQVTISPAAAITAGAQWQVDGGVEQSSAAIVLGLSVGNHTVSFSPVNGWAMPASQSVAVSANSTATASPTYGQLTYTTNNGAITITKFQGKGDTVLPGTINGLPVTTIGSTAFKNCTSLTGVTIPGSVTNIGSDAFGTFNGLTNLIAITVNPTNSFYSSTNGVLFNKNQTILLQYPGGVGGSYTIPQTVTNIGSDAFDYCANLTSVTIPNSVTFIAKGAFYECISLTNVTLGTNVASIEDQAFQDCYSLTSVVIPSSVTLFGSWAFAFCSSLTGVYFQGNTAYYFFDFPPFDGDTNATVYYLPWTTGWGTPGTPFGGCPTALWLPQAQTGDASFGAQNNQFGFNITWASDTVVVVEACTDLANPDWTPVGTNTLTGDSSYFSDSQWTNYPGRFYRLRSP